MKKKYFLFALFLVGNSVARCQNVISDVTNNFPIIVVMKVQDVIVAANVAQSEQVPLAIFFQHEAGVIDSASNNGVTSQQLGVIQAQLVAQFQSILSVQELVQFTANRPNSVYATPPPAQTTHSQ